MIFQIWDWEVVICTYLEKQLRLFFKLNYIFLWNKYIIQDSPDDVQILHTRSKLMAFLEVMGEWQWHPDPELGYPDQRSSSRARRIAPYCPHLIVSKLVSKRDAFTEIFTNSQKIEGMIEKQKKYFSSNLIISISFRILVTLALPRAKNCWNKLSISFNASLKDSLPRNEILKFHWKF